MKFANNNPLLSFVVLSFNQEEYIEQAVNNAIGQTYRPIEIIISDDASTDKTFDIITNAVGKYLNGENIVVKRNPVNLGLIQHVNKIFENARGEVIVLAAGDDISEPERAKIIMSEFLKNQNLLAVHSSVNAIDKFGNKLEVRKPPVEFKEVNINQLALSQRLIIGASAAYHKDLYRKYGPIVEENTFEDLIYGFRAALSNGLGYIDMPLVNYRVGVGLSARKRHANITERRINREREIIHVISTLKQRLYDCMLCKSFDTNSLRAMISKEIKRKECQLMYRANLKGLYCKLLSSSVFIATYAIFIESGIEFKAMLLNAKSRITENVLNK